MRLRGARLLPADHGSRPCHAAHWQTIGERATAAPANAQPLPRAPPIAIRPDPVMQAPSPCANRPKAFGRWLQQADHPHRARDRRRRNRLVLRPRRTATRRTSSRPSRSHLRARLAHVHDEEEDDLHRRLHGNRPARTERAPEKVVRVRARTSVKLSFYRRSGKYKLYCADSSPRVTGTVAPNHAAHPLRFILQHYSARRWRTTDTAAIPIQSAGSPTPSSAATRPEATASGHVSPATATTSPTRRPGRTCASPAERLR